MSGYTGLIGLATTGQSPINLDDRLTRPRRYPPLVLNGHWLQDGEAHLTNTGNVAKITLTGDRIPSTVSGGPLADDVYEFSDLHFHWGATDCWGAEHMINNTWYSMESHAVHWNRKYITYEECFRHKDGFCLLSNLFLVQPCCCSCTNPQTERITENLKCIVEADSEVKIPSNSLAFMRNATYSTRYYTYSGSYNVGEYCECTTYIVFPVVTPIQPSEIAAFRKLRNKDGQCILSNRREIQPLKYLDPNIETAKLIQQLGYIDGHFESPINLDITFMKVIELNPLQWVNADITPRKLKVTNTGFTVLLSTTWETGRACITGGPLLGNYLLSQIHYHWGKDEMNGSEHLVDGGRMPMELHVVFFKDEYEKFNVALKQIDGVVIVVYFFKNKPNEFIRKILKHVSEIRTADSSTRMTPVSLSSIVKPFSEDYFLYWGSIVIRNNPYKILWLIGREPIGVSVEQIATFRSLTNDKGLPILSNVREVHEREERTVFHVCPSGSTYASLLPLPWNLPRKPNEPSQSTIGTTTSTN